MGKIVSHTPNYGNQLMYASISSVTRTSAAVLLAFLLTTAAHAELVAVGIVDGSDNTNWVTNGLATLNGATAGVAWKISGQQQNTAWVFVSGGSQRSLSGTPIEWPTAGTSGTLGYVADEQIMRLGPQINTLIASDGGGPYLQISMVAPAAGDYSINGGNTQTATALGQVLRWIDTDPTVDEQYTWTSTATIDETTIANGPVAFATASAVPEPSTLALLLALATGLFLRWRRR